MSCLVLPPRLLHLPLGRLVPTREDASQQVSRFQSTVLTGK